MECPEGGVCPDPEWCQQGGPCETAKKYESPDRADRYAATLDTAARHARTAYRYAYGDALTAADWQEYDQLDDEGKAAWRAVVTRAVYDMLPVVRDGERARAEAPSAVVVCPHCNDEFTAEDLFDGDVLIVCTMCAKAGRSAASLGDPQ
jgi:formylmethanofuran dehydrogenase subunit E